MACLHQLKSTPLSFSSEFNSKAARGRSICRLGSWGINVDGYTYRRFMISCKVKEGGIKQTNDIDSGLKMEARRSGDFGAGVWDNDYAESLTTPYNGKEYLKEAEKLKNQVKIIINETTDQTEQLELIDTLQRLCIAYHFEDEVRGFLQKIYGTDDKYSKKDLHITALKFRLLREHGFYVPQEIFSSFLDDDGNFKASLTSDVKGLVSLHEASFLGMEGESILDMAKDFSSRHLKEMVEQITDPILSEEVKHALELSLHWRVPKLEAKWFIHAYKRRSDANLVLLRLAKLDFNILQAMYQDEIKSLSRWCKATGVKEKLGFARHRMTEHYFWALEFFPGPHSVFTRQAMAKNAEFITLLDDIYDVYGTLDELEELTKALERWDVNELDHLPEYMQIFFLALFNFANELGYDVLRDQGINIIPNLKRLWAELGNAYYLEAKWFHKGYFPSTDEYLNHAWVSITGPMLLLHAYLTSTNPINIEVLQSLEKYPAIIKWPSMILRLVNDLATAPEEMKRGDIPKVVQCYMHDTGCSQEDASKYVQDQIGGLLKKMNKEILMEKAFENFGPTVMNFIRTIHYYYQDTDGKGVVSNVIKKDMVSLIVQPIPMP